MCSHPAIAPQESGFDVTQKLHIKKEPHRKAFGIQKS